MVKGRKGKVREREGRRDGEKGEGLMRLGEDCFLAHERDRRL